MKSLGERTPTSIGLQNSSAVAFALGRLGESHALAGAGLTVAAAAQDDTQRMTSLAFRAIAAHSLGDIPAARADFAAATGLEGEPLYSLRDSRHARHHLDLGDLAPPRALCDHSIEAERGSAALMPPACA